MSQHKLSERRIAMLRERLMKARGLGDRGEVKRLEAEIHELWTRLMALMPKQ
jgi:hypothetical protein